MAGNYSEFKHENMTESEADFLIESYKKRGLSAKKIINEPSKGWGVSVFLEEDHVNYPSRMHSPKMWGNANVTQVSGRGYGDKNTGGSRT
ncbi:hypothetical protein V2A84_09665 [Yersinia sp. 2553 StPb PI]|uniref:hypothetical protein n=1 Tax=Yersinia sp. 2553 StPb PI TaxID=3117411 RepID=UPI003FA44EE4